MLQISDTTSSSSSPPTRSRPTVYLVVGIVVYVYVRPPPVLYADALQVGADVSSPAISNLGTTLARITYGIAIPTIIIAGASAVRAPR